MLLCIPTYDSTMMTSCHVPPVVNKSKMLSAGVADVVLKFLQSEMPPVQFKLLGTLRMLIDTQGRKKPSLPSCRSVTASPRISQEIQTTLAEVVPPKKIL